MRMNDALPSNDWHGPGIKISGIHRCTWNKQNKQAHSNNHFSRTTWVSPRDLFAFHDGSHRPHEWCHDPSRIVERRHGRFQTASFMTSHGYFQTLQRHIPLKALSLRNVFYARLSFPSRKLFSEPEPTLPLASQ